MHIDRNFMKLAYRSNSPCIKLDRHFLHSTPVARDGPSPLAQRLREKNEASLSKSSHTAVTDSLVRCGDRRCNRSHCAVRPLLQCTRGARVLVGRSGSAQLRVACCVGNGHEKRKRHFMRSFWKYTMYIVHMVGTVAYVEEPEP